jgi:hypothetical protein
MKNREDVLSGSIIVQPAGAAEELLQIRIIGVQRWKPETEPLSFPPESLRVWRDE